MNCGDFRYLIQRRFDVELSPPDDRALLIHLETCESCQKFYHQVQQVIIAAEEMHLPEDLLQPQSELLGNKIVQNIPHYESGILTIFSQLLSNLAFLKLFKKGATGGPLVNPSNGDQETRSPPVRVENWNDINPERTNQNVLAGRPSVSDSLTGGRVVGAWGATNAFPDSSNPPLADLVNYANTSASGEQSGVVDEQKATGSLGQKFSRFAAIPADNAGTAANQHLNLAESIRRRIAEMPKSAPAEVSSQPMADPGITSESNIDSVFDSQTFSHWGIPQSPDWPKINTDIDLDKTAPPQGSTAPSSWGKAEGSWGNQVNIQAQQPAQAASDTARVGGWMEITNSGEYKVLNSEEANAIAQAVPGDVNAGANAVMETHAEEDQQQHNWSKEAEQLETGNWQTVEFEAGQLGKFTANNLSPAASASPPPPPTQENIDRQPTEVQKQEVQKQEPQQPQIDLVTRLQHAVQSTTGGPKIYPVVSKHSRSEVIPALTVPASVNTQPANAAAVPASVNTQPANAAAVPASVNTQPASAAAVPASVNTQPASAIAVPPVKAPAVPVNEKPLPVSGVAKSVSETANAGQSTGSTRLFNLDDPAIDKLFSENLGVHERSSAASAPGTAEPKSLPVMPPSSAPAPSALPSSSAAPPQLSSPANAPSPLFTIDDTVIDRIFSDNLGVPRQIDNMPADNIPPSTVSLENIPTEAETQAQAQAQAQAEAQAQRQARTQGQAQAEMQIRPSSSASSLPPVQGAESAFTQSVSRQKITGVDRLDGRAEPVSEGGSGRIAAIGKFLLDNKDLEKIGKITASDFSERGMRTLSLEAHQELSNLLKQIDSQVGVIGTMIVGHDGLLIANTMPQDLEPESLSKWAQAIYMGTAQTTEQLGNERVRQIVSQTERGYLIIANFGAGLLISITNPLMVDHLLPLMRTITQLVAA